MSKRFVFFIAFFIGLLATWSLQADALELCVAKRGAVRVALENRPCKAKETAVTVGEMGAAGVQGPAGPQGPQGPTGPAGTNGTNGQDGQDGATGVSSGLDLLDATGQRLGRLIGHATAFDDFNNVRRRYDAVTGEEIVETVDFFYALPNCAGPKLVTARPAQGLCQNSTDVATIAPGVQPTTLLANSMRSDTGVCSDARPLFPDPRSYTEIVVLTIETDTATGPLFVAPAQP